MLRVDSRQIKPGDTFLALRGVDNDGHKYIDTAIKNGASKVICEEGHYEVETQIVPSTLTYLAEYLKTYYAEMMAKITLIGVTGTNGKSTVAFLLYKAYNALGVKAAYIGTIGFYIDDKIKDLDNTTPVLYDIYQLIEQAYQAGTKVIIIEASSQGLAYERLRGFSFDQAIYTNLTEDHLDFHKTISNYIKAKQILFKQIKKDGVAIINADDSHYRSFMLDNYNITYGFKNSDYQITNYELGFKQTSFDYQYNNDSYHIKTSLIGKFNLYNLLAVIASLHEYGFSNIEIGKLIPNLETPPGRMNLVSYKDNLIIIDFAHTTDAFQNIFEAMNEISHHHLYAVFGCTGNRERTKRPVMLKAATDKCDYVIITNDDPYYEDPNQIVADMTYGIKATNYEVELNRNKAIYRGMAMLKQKDILLILGRGHEENMIINGQKIASNDLKIVKDNIDLNTNL